MDPNAPLSSQALPPAMNRPLSRASTSSIHTVSAQPILDHFAEPLHQFAQWHVVDAPASSTVASAAASITNSTTLSSLQPEELIIQATSQFRAGGNPDYSATAHMDLSYHNHDHIHNHNHNLSHSHTHHPHHSTAVPVAVVAVAAPTDSSFVALDADAQMLDRDDDFDADADPDVSAVAPATQKASSRNSANNEMEMKNLFHGNCHRSLQDVATELHGNERGPHSERARQIFAMLWINQVCSKGKGSVPRGRVYANYASRCATERITVLNPASFGKLVRVLFPGLKTRRLGVRGESKYHYVSFAMVDDSSEPKRLALRPASASDPSQQPFYILPPAPESALPVSVTGATALRRRLSNRPSQASTPRFAAPDVSHSFYNCPDLSRMDMMEATSAKTELGFCFPPEEEEPLDSDLIILPSISPHLPPGTDPDAAQSLVALYRSHCTSLVECIRFCKEKTFFHLFTSFQGTLTLPVQRLFGKPAIAPWIEECDCMLYQRMMRIIARLTLQVLPDPVLSILRSIHGRLTDHIREAFEGQPHHVIAAKVAPATLFTSVVHRTLRVNLAAHAAANMLANDANRDQMYYDWITLIRPRNIAEHVPTRGMDDVVSLLINEMRSLLEPRAVPWEVEFVTVYADVPAQCRDGPQTSANGTSEPMSPNVLDRWVNLLRSLPRRFPYASHAEIVWCVERVGTAVMRDITMSQGKSFGAWWVTKTWIDEMVWLLAERGAFMQLITTNSNANRLSAAFDSMPPIRARTASWARSAGSDPHADGDAEDIPLEQDDGRDSGIACGIACGMASGMASGQVGPVKAQPDRAPFPSADGAHLYIHDDSGIGSEEEFRIDKLNAGGLVAAEGRLMM